MYIVIIIHHSSTFLLIQYSQDVDQKITKCKNPTIFISNNGLGQDDNDDVYEIDQVLSGNGVGFLVVVMMMMIMMMFR